MTSGRTYEVFVDGKPVGLVGSTTRTLKERRCGGYAKRFGSGVELQLLREIPRPENYSDEDYNFRLKAAEAFDIARKNTYVENGGLNKISPLIQALGSPMLEVEKGRLGNREGKARGGRIVGFNHKENMTGIFAPGMQAKGGRIGGKIVGCKTKKDGIGIFAPGMKTIAGRIGGRKNAESGHIQALGNTQGFKNVKSGHLIKISPAGNCQRWNINRGKLCVCGKHVC